MVDLRLVCAAQPTIYVEDATTRVRDLTAADIPGIAAVTQPLSSPKGMPVAFDPHKNAWLFSSPNPNLRIAGQFNAELAPGVNGFGFIVEVALILTFGVDKRMVEAPYIGKSFALGEMRIPLRMLVAVGVALVLTLAISAYLSRTFTGRAIKAVAQDEMALSLMGADPVRIKHWAFAIATSTCALAGALLIIVNPVEPGLGRLYIGRTFCVAVLAGLGSMPGTLVAGMILGITESLVLNSLGASWAPAVAFGLLLIVLAVRPTGLFGR